VQLLDRKDMIEKILTSSFDSVIFSAKKLYQYACKLPPFRW